MSGKKSPPVVTFQYAPPIAWMVQRKLSPGRTLVPVGSSLPAPSVELPPPLYSTLKLYVCADASCATLTASTRPTTAASLRTASPFGSRFRIVPRSSRSSPQATAPRQPHKAACIPAPNLHDVALQPLTRLSVTIFGPFFRVPDFAKIVLRILQFSLRRPHSAAMK